MEINEFNYEAYALDYAAGSLTGVELEAMEQFLDSQPELRAEIMAIAAVSVPFEAVQYDGLENLERQPERKGIIIPFSVLALAASLLLLFGIFWMTSSQLPDGRLADRSPVIRVHYPVALIFEAERSADDSRDEFTTIPNYMDVNDQLDGTNERFAAVDTDGTQNTSDQQNVEQKTRIVWKVVEPKPEDFLEMMPESEYRNLEVTEIQPDNYFILPITIEKPSLQTDGFERASLQLAADNERLERRRVLREGALSILQQNLVPVGINDLIEE